MTPRRWLLAALAAVALLLVVGRVGGALYVDHAWYESMGAGAIWRAKVLHTLLLRGVTLLLGTAFVFANLYSVRHSIVSLVLPRRIGDLEIGEEVPGRTLMVGVLLLSAALGALLTLPYGDWTLLAQAWRGRAYGELDPYHQVDLGYWVHWLPLEVALYHWALLALLVVSIVVVVLYALTPSLRWDRGTVRVTTYVRRHLVVLGALALMLLAWSYRLDEYRLLITGSGEDGMFGWGDHRVRLSANTVLAALALVMAGMVALTGWMGQMRRAFVGVTVVLVLSVVLRQALPAILERTRAPREFAAREGPYARTRAIYSRRAVGLEPLLPTADAPRIPAGQVGTVSAWDERALQVALARSHRGSTVVGATGWRAGEQGIEALLVMRPASDASSDPATAWLSASVDASLVIDGAPDARERPLPPPLVWPGARGWAIVDDPGNRVPAARLASPLARLAHAWGEQNLRFLDGRLGAPNTKLVLHRDVRERLLALVPFFVQGQQVSPALADGVLHWMVPLYSATDWYPLAAPVIVNGKEWRSWRHAATAVVDASTGRVRLVRSPEPDSLASGWIRMFPALFTAPDSLPAALAAQLPPAVDGAMAKAAVLGVAGLRRETSAVRREPAVFGGDSLVAEGPTPFVADGRTAVALPLVDGAGTLSGVLVARGGLVPGVGWVPAGSGAPTWELTRDRLLRRTDTASTAREGRVLPGSLRALPMSSGELALLMTEYRWRGDAAPELTRLSALRGDRVYAGATLASALGFADRAAATSPPMPRDANGRAAVLYDRMRDALRRGDWRAFGEAFDALGQALGRRPR